MAREILYCSCGFALFVEWRRFAGILAFVLSGGKNGPPVETCPHCGFPLEGNLLRLFVNERQFPNGKRVI